MSDMSTQNLEMPRLASGQDLVGNENAPAIDSSSEPIGIVLEIGGAGSQIALDLNRLTDCAGNEDPSVAQAGQVGSQVKIRVGRGWLLATVRNQKQDAATAGGILAAADFLGEGNEERLTGRLHSFHRGVTRYPIPGALVYPATTRSAPDLFQ
jgi:hypothetical protein